MLFGNISGSIGETSALALLIGGIILLLFKIIDWRIPVIYIGTVMVLTQIFGHDPIYHVLSGGLMIGALRSLAVLVMGSEIIEPKARANQKVLKVIFILGVLAMVVMGIFPNWHYLIMMQFSP